MIVLPKNESGFINLSSGDHLNSQDPSLTIISLRDHIKANLKSLKMKDMSNELPDGEQPENKAEDENLRQGLFGQKKVQFKFD